MPLSNNKSAANEKFRVLAVTNNRLLSRFIQLPSRLYREDPAWIKPLTLERRHFYSPANPFFQHARWQAWIATEGGRTVGRVSAQLDELYERQHGQRVAYFGALEAESENAIAPLLAMAVDWARNHGAVRMDGPFNLSINQECGLLVEGFGDPPMVMMGHAQPWYGEQVERSGFRRVVDLLAYRVVPKFDPPASMQRLLRNQAGRFHVRALDRKRFAEDMSSIRDIFNDASMFRTSGATLAATRPKLEYSNHKPNNTHHLPRLCPPLCPGPEEVMAC